MNCYLCLDRSIVFCPCSKRFICSNHIAQHLSEEGSHCIELFDRILSKLQLKALQDKLFDWIKLLDEAKNSIMTQMKDCIQKIMNSSNSAIKELEIRIQWYLKLVSANIFSPTLINEVNHILNSELNIDLLKKGLGSNITLLNQEIRYPKVTEVLASNRFLEVCMGCSVFGNVFRVSCKHLLCAECSKTSCKMCEILDKNEEKNNYSTTPNKLNKMCFLCKRFIKTGYDCNCGHSICEKCVHDRCCGIKINDIQKTCIGMCEMCKKSKTQIKNSLCKHLRCDTCAKFECQLCVLKKKRASLLEKKKRAHLFEQIKIQNSVRY